MGYKEIATDIKNNQLGRLYLFWGSEHYLVDHAIRGMKNKVLEEGFADLNYQLLDGKEIMVDQIIHACETLPFMADARMVVVKDLECFVGKRKNISEEDEKRLMDYLRDIPSTTHLVFVVTEGIDKRKKIVKDMSKNGKVIEFNRLSGADLNKWVIKAFGKYGKKLGEKDIHYFLDTTGYLDRGSSKNLKDVENEIQKLCDYVGDREDILQGDIELLAPKTLENNIFTLIECIGEKKGERALLFLNDMLLEGESEIKILFMITRQFRLLYQIKLLEVQGYTAMAIAPKLSLQQFIVKKYLKQAVNFDTKTLQRALQKCLHTDECIKTGKLEQRLGIELLISEFTH